MPKGLANSRLETIYASLAWDLDPCASPAKEFGVRLQITPKRFPSYNAPSNSEFRFCIARRRSPTVPDTSWSAANGNRYYYASLFGDDIDWAPDFVIDDYPEIVSVFGGVCIKDYVFRHQEDQEMWAVLARIDAHQAPAPEPCSPAAD